MPRYCCCIALGVLVGVLVPAAVSVMLIEFVDIEKDFRR